MSVMDHRTDPVDVPAEPSVGGPAGLGPRAEILARVLSGDLRDRDACDALGVEPLVLARWKLHTLEAIEAHDPAAGDVPDDHVGELSHRLRTVEPRVVATVAIGWLAFATIVTVVSPVAAIEALDTLNRWSMYVATLFAAGGTIFLWQIHDRRGTAEERATLVWWVRAGAIAGVIASALALAIHGAVLVGAGPFDLLDHHSISRAADGSFGASVALRAIGLGYIAYAIGRRRAASSARLVAGVGAVLALASFLLVGHTVTAEPRALVIVANLLHTTAGAGWFGGLVLLGLTMRHRRVVDDLVGAATVVRRFSRFAMGSVAAVVVAGTTLAIVELPDAASLLGDPYGRMVLAKTILVGVVLVAADRNHRKVVPAVVAHDPAAWSRLRRTVSIEVAGLVLVLLATALLVNLSPPS